MFFLKSWFAWLLLAILLVGAVVACGDDDDDGGDKTAAATSAAAATDAAAEETPGEPFTIDLVLPYSGASGEFGPRIQSGIELAFEEHYGSVINGRPIKFERHDNLCTPEGATNAVNQVLDSATLIYGMGCSGATIAVIPTIDNEGIPQVDLSLTDDATKQGSSHYFQVTVRTSDAVRGVLQHMKDEGISTFGGMMDDTGFSQSSKPFMESIATELGLDLTGFYEFKRGDTDFAAVLSRAKDDNPEAIFVYSYAVEGGLIAKQMEQLGIDIPLFGSTVFINKEFIEAAGDAAEGKVFATALLPDDPSPPVADFVELWRGKSGGEDPNDQVSLGYAGGLVMAAALEAAGTDWTRESITEALRGVSVETPIGTVEFDETGAPIGLVPTIGIIKDGKPSFLESLR